ncbi:hypothetical protein SUGI_0200940 [Cryptomeria japonica]|nr:hypothetical protein SUGI_0200940 [Cryptomeria japonica]
MTTCITITPPLQYRFLSVLCEEILRATEFSIYVRLNRNINGQDDDEAALPALTLPARIGFYSQVRNAYARFPDDILKPDRN